ncbi:basic proline-rich protein-like [Bubalus bubalis]|uniref:basic proline-rich protein-like n=1 Tax=Bubalus bubalis TaxID=89462 RepID=UPI001E1B6E34|nr:basic proline-rich protein-like [Bubalus bubalis]
MNGTPLPHERGSPRPRRFARPAPGPEDKSGTGRDQRSAPYPHPPRQNLPITSPSPKQRSLPLTPRSSLHPPLQPPTRRHHFGGAAPSGYCSACRERAQHPSPSPGGHLGKLGLPPPPHPRPPTRDGGPRAGGQTAGLIPSEGGNEPGPGLTPTLSERSFRSAPGPGRAPRAHLPRPEPRNLCPAPPLQACAPPAAAAAEPGPRRGSRGPGARSRRAPPPPGHPRPAPASPAAAESPRRAGAGKFRVPNGGEGAAAAAAAGRGRGRLLAPECGGRGGRGGGENGGGGRGRDAGGTGAASDLRWGAAAGTPTPAGRTALGAAPSLRPPPPPPPPPPGEGSPGPQRAPRPGTPPIALLPSPSTAPSLRPPPPPGAPARSPTRGLPIAHPHGPQPAPDPAAGKGDPGAPAPSPTLVLPTALTHPQRGLVPVIQIWKVNNKLTSLPRSALRGRRPSATAHSRVAAQPNLALSGLPSLAARRELLGNSEPNGTRKKASFVCFDGLADASHF